jgi:hypothetical protein
VLPEFVAACGFQNAKAPDFEADGRYSVVSVEVLFVHLCIS